MNPDTEGVFLLHPLLSHILSGQIRSILAKMKGTTEPLHTSVFLSFMKQKHAEEMTSY